MQETQVWSLGWEDPLEKVMATHSSILAQRMPWTEESGRLQSMRLQRVGHDWVTNTHTHTHTLIQMFSAAESSFPQLNALNWVLSESGWIFSEQEIVSRLSKAKAKKGKEKTVSLCNQDSGARGGAILVVWTTCSLLPVRMWPWRGLGLAPSRSQMGIV